MENIGDLCYKLDYGASVTQVFVTLECLKIQLCILYKANVLDLDDQVLVAEGSRGGSQEQSPAASISQLHMAPNRSVAIGQSWGMSDLRGRGQEVLHADFFNTMLIGG